MKVFLMFVGALAFASAYNDPQYDAVIGKNGVPIDTVEVQHARAAHLSQLAAAYHYNAHSNYNAESTDAHTEYIYHGPQHMPVINKNGVPVDTVEVQHARSAHLSHLAAANAHYSVDHVTPVHKQDEEYSGSVYHGPQHIPIIDKHGVPVETVEVQHAKAAHLAATKSAASKSHEYEHDFHGKTAPVLSYVEHKSSTYHGPQHITVIGKQGVPLDTAELQQARAVHLSVNGAQKHQK